MKALLLTVVNFYLIYSSYGRLMYRTTDNPKTNIEDPKESQVSKEEKSHHSPEYFRFYNRKIRASKVTNQMFDKSKNVTDPKSNSKSKVVLVKKPIPKFNDADSDEDYQSKMRMPTKYSDTAEHEDEDFNLDDYDFDVNHDEFAGRGKPLEPRTKIKLNGQQPQRFEPKLAESRPQPVIKVPATIARASNKVPRKVADKMKEDEYDDEFPDKKTTESSVKATNSDDDTSDEMEDSKEYEYKGSVRTARSPFSFSNYMDKLGEKTSAFMSRVLSILPIFPQQPSPKRLDEEVSLIKEQSMQRQKI